jgi:hypothetical protein
MPVVIASQKKPPSKKDEPEIQKGVSEGHPKAM